LSFHSFIDWSERFLVLVERYTDTIKGQIYGHVHQDYFSIMKGTKKQPVGIGMVGPSLSTYVYLYPAFRVYDMNEFTHDLIDYTQYHLDLLKANKELKAEWEVAYKFTEYYGVPDLSIESHELLVEKMKVSNKVNSRMIMRHGEERCI